MNILFSCSFPPESRKRPMNGSTQHYPCISRSQRTREASLSESTCSLSGKTASARSHPFLFSFNPSPGCRGSTPWLTANQGHRVALWKEDYWTSDPGVHQRQNWRELVGTNLDVIPYELESTSFHGANFLLFYMLPVICDILVKMGSEWQMRTHQ